MPDFGPADDRVELSRLGDFVPPLLSVIAGMVDLIGFFYRRSRPLRGALLPPEDPLKGYLGLDLNSPRPRDPNAFYYKPNRPDGPRGRIQCGVQAVASRRAARAF
jgi:hypothetical protein